jgi:uncharacterized protein DUF5681
MDTLLKKPEIVRDDMGRFDRHGKTLSKTAKNSQSAVVVDKLKITGPYKPGQSGNPAGRKKGSKNKMTVALREAILQALEAAGGEEGAVGYLRRLAVENSSAFASLLGKTLPTTLQASESGGGAVKVEFQRIIVHPDGRREIDGVTPKQIEHRPASHMLPRDDVIDIEPRDIKDSD